MSLVIDEYHTLEGKPIKISPAVKKRLEALLGKDRSWDCMCCETVVTRTDAPFQLPVVLEKGQDKFPLSWIVMQEDGSINTGSQMVGNTEIIAVNGNLEKRNVQVNVVLPMGYHRIKVQFNGKAPLGGRETTIISVPHRCYFPEGHDRLKGLAVQLYSLVSERNWGIGDFSDLKSLIRQSPQLGIDFIGLNPINVLYIEDPEFASPYSSSSRIFLNPLYIDVTSVYEYEDNERVKRHVAAVAFQKRLKAARAGNIVKYAEVSELKLEVLRMIYDDFLEHDIKQRNTRAMEFRAFCREKGKPLDQMAVFQALSVHFSRKGVHGFTGWPKEFRDPSSAKVKEFSAKNNKEVGFYLYLQWLAHEQYKEAADLTKEVGMKVGIYMDIPVGVSDGSAEVWMAPDVFVPEVSVGVPPDGYSKTGQVWGMPPMSPVALKEKKYAPFIDIIREYMRHSGAVRIDHAMQLERLFWVFNDGKSGYVSYPLGDLIGIMALESHRNRCLVIGENIGTLPYGFNELLQETNIFGMKMFRYMGDFGYDNFSVYHNEPFNILSLGNHDMPTVAGMWSGRYIKEMHELGKLTRKGMKESQEKLKQDRVEVVCRLAQKGIWFNDRDDVLDDDTCPSGLCRALYRYMNDSPCAMFSMTLEDLTGRYEQVNVPGTTAERPNWRYKIAVDIDRLAEGSVFP